MAYVKVTDATSEPITLEDAKTHLREDLDDEANDAYIESLITVARQAAEDRTGKTLLATTWQRTLDGFPCEIDLEHGPVSAVSWVKYYDDAGALQTLASDQYDVDLVSTPARIAPAYGVIWPATRSGRPNAVQVQFVAGYADAAAIPAAIVHWIKLAITEMYEMRNRSSDRPAVPHDFADALLGNGHTHWCA